MKCQNGLLRDERDSTICIKAAKSRKMSWTEFLPFFILGIIFVGLFLLFI